MFIKRAKSRPSLRAKELDNEALSSSPLSKSSIVADEASDLSMTVDDDEGGSVMERKKAKGKEKNRLNKGSRLSFGGDGEDVGTPFKPKKSLLSQSLKLPSTPIASEPAPTPPTGSSIYSREYLSQLKASTPTRAPKDAKDNVEEEEDDGGLSKAAREKYASRIVEDTTAGIPDPVAIASAKQKRQAAVEVAKHDLGDDYVSLGGGQIAVYDGEKGPHPESRLMREEDEEGDGDEDLAEYTGTNDKVYLGKKANKDAARRLKGEIGELIDDREMEDEDDEETREWEEAQARRAGNWEPERPPPVVKKSYAPAPIPVARPVPTVNSAQARVAKAIAELKGSRAESEHNLEITVRDLAQLEVQERDLRKEVERMEDKREWVEEFRGWVEMLGTFLEEKIPKLEDIEADSVHHLKERAEMTNKRRAADDEDDLSLFLGTAAVENVKEEVDDMGRSRNAEAGPSSAIRRARRSEREGRRLKRRIRKPQRDEDGFSTDSTLADGDAEDYSIAQRDLEKRVNTLLEDVRAEDFRDPAKGLAVRFGDWRKRYEDEYVNAFGGLAMVQAWEFWARGEMVGWEPLRASMPIESFAWFNALHHYSRPKFPSNGDAMDMEDEEPPLGPDGDLVSEMVSKAVVPLLTKDFEAGAYDPYSAPQTRKAVDLADVVRELTGKDSRKYTTLLKAILGVFHNHLLSLAALISSSLSPVATPAPAFDQASRAALNRFVRKRAKLLRNILLWRREAPAEIKELVNRLVGEVIRPSLSRHWEGGGRELGAEILLICGNELRPDLVAFLRDGPGRPW